MYLTSDLRREVFLNEFPKFHVLDKSSVQQLIDIYDSNIKSASQQSMPHLVIFGGIIMLYAWLFLNCFLEIHTEKRPLEIVFNTLCTASFSGFSYFLPLWFSRRKGNKINLYEPVPLMNAFVSGLVASSGNCGYVS